MSRLTKHRQRYPLRLRLSPYPPACDEDGDEDNGDEDDASRIWNARPVEAEPHRLHLERGFFLPSQIFGPATKYGFCCGG